MKVTEHHLDESQPAESVSSTSYYVKGTAVILGTGAAYAIAKTTGVLSWLWSGIEAYTSSATTSEEKAVQMISSAIQASPQADPPLSPLKPTAGSVSSRRAKELDSLDLIELNQKSEAKATPSTTAEIQSPFQRRLLQTTTPAEMTINYCDPTGICQMPNLADGQVGFSLQSTAFDSGLGSLVSPAGDINGDQIDDILIGTVWSQKLFVVFGSHQMNSWTANSYIEALMDGYHGFSLQFGDFFNAIAAGDFNGDQLNDILVGGFQTLTNAYVILSSNQSNAWGTGVLNITDLMDGQRGFILQSTSRTSVSAGDINGDGCDDIIIGIPNSFNTQGSTTVVFGSNQTGAWNATTFNLASLTNGQQGFVLLGNTNDYSSWPVITGDINGDSIEDILIGTAYDYISKIYIVFGTIQTNAWSGGTYNLVDLTVSMRGVLLQGPTAVRAGWSLSAGDFNGDRCDDILIGTRGSIEEVYLIFGSNQSNAWINSTLNLDVLTADQRGFVMRNAQDSAVGGFGTYVSGLGDINADHYIDFGIGGSTNGNTYIVFGSLQLGNFGSTLDLGTFVYGQHGFILQTPTTNGEISIVTRAGDINGDHIDDLLCGDYQQFDGGIVNVIFGDSPAQITVNQLSIGVGDTIILNAGLLAAQSQRQSNATIILTPENVQHGRFEAIHVPTVALTNFLFANVTQGQIQFVQDHSGSNPSYQIATRHTALIHAYSIAQINFLGYAPVLLNNALYVNQGQPTIVTTASLSASDADTPSTVLQFIFSEVQHAQFNLVDNNGQIIVANITTCSQQAVFDQTLQLIPDGSIVSPSYHVAVSNGRTTIPSQPAAITFNQAPVLTLHAITLDQGQTTVMRPTDISASDDHTLSDDLLFQVANVTEGDYFEYPSNVGYALSAFNQLQLAVGNVAFFQNGSNLSPTFFIRVTDGQIATAWQAPIIHFNHRPLPQRTIPTQTVIEGESFSIALGEGLFIDPDNNPLTLTAQQIGDVPLPNGFTFDANRTELNGILETLISLQIQIIASDPRGLTASTNFTLQSTTPVSSGLNLRNLYNTLSAFGGLALTVMGYMWWRRKAFNHRVGYEFANTLRKILNLEYYDFTKEKGELYKTHIQSFLADLKYQHNNFYATLKTQAERDSFAACVAEIIRGKNLLKKSSCLSATYNRFFLFNRSWPNSLDLNAFAKLSSQIAQEAVTAWNSESQKQDGDPLTRWAYRSSSAPESKAMQRSEINGVEIAETKEIVTNKSSASSAGYSDSLFSATTRKSSRETIHGQVSGAVPATEMSL